MTAEGRIEEGIIQNLSGEGDDNNASKGSPKTKRETVVKNGEPKDAKVDITADSAGTVANLIITAPKNGGRPATVEMVLNALKASGIVAGIDEYDIKQAIKEKVYDVPVCIARAIPAKRGNNGSITFNYDKERKLKPLRDEFGVANYRELNFIVPIRKGDVIAKITLPTEGTPGENIFGKTIPAEKGLAPKITVGKNTAVTAAGTEIVAMCDGHLVYGTGCFNVETTVTVKKDLDMSIGNIDFFGDVHIMGNVMEGFVITAGGSVKIDGSVFDGIITAGGDVNIVGGAINTRIKCENNVSIGFCENSSITAKGNVESKQFAFCDVFCYGGLTAKGNTGVISGGKITSMRDVQAGIIGSEKYTRTEINIGDGSVIFARKKQAEQELCDSENAIASAERNIAFLKHRRNLQGGLLTESQQRQIKTETQNKLFHNMRKKELTKLISQLENDIRNKDNLCAKVSGIIYPGACFCINFLTLEVTEASPRSTVTIVDNKLIVMPN